MKTENNITVNLQYVTVKLKLNNKIDRERKELNKWMNDRATIQGLLIEVSRDDKVVNLDKVAEIKDDKTRYDIIHEVFDCAFIDRIEQYRYTISITLESSTSIYFEYEKEYCLYRCYRRYS